MIKEVMKILYRPSLLLFCCTIYLCNGVIYWCENHNPPGQITSSTGTIITRINGTSVYDNNMDCSWHLNATPGKHWLLTTSVYDVEWAPDGAICNPYDPLIIRAGSNAVAPEILAACGPNGNPHSVISNGLGLFLSWRSSPRNIKARAGITANFQVFDVGVCPPGWTEQKGHCYKVAQHRENWDRAQTYCNYDQSNLASISDNDEYTYIKGILGSSNAFIGLYDSSGKQSFKYIDQVPYRTLSGNMWNPGYPFSSDRKKCVVIEQGKLSQKTCDIDTDYFICKMKKGGGTILYDAPNGNTETTKPASKGLDTWVTIVIIIVAVIVAIATMIGMWKGHTIYKQRQDNRSMETREQSSSNGSVSYRSSVSPSAPLQNSRHQRQEDSVDDASPHKVPQPRRLPSIDRHPRNNIEMGVVHPYPGPIISPPSYEEAIGPGVHV